MRCKEIRSIVDEVGDLDRLPVEAARHVGACDECERFGRELVALRALLREPGRVAVTPDFDAAVARRIRAAKSPARERTGIGAWFALPSNALATAAAVGLLAVGTFTVYEVSRPTYNTGLQPPPAASSTSVASNAGVPVLPPTVAPPVQSELGQATIPVGSPASVAGSVQQVHYKQKPPSTPYRDPSPSGAMMLVSDGSGTRVVNVPTVLVGSERALPSHAVATVSTTPAGVSF